jgi:signal transduction histidine kinase
MLSTDAPECANGKDGREGSHDAEIAAMIAHELTAPIAALRMSADLMLSGSVPPADQTRLLTIVHRQATRIERLVREVVDVFRYQDGQLQRCDEPVDLLGLCEEVVADMQSLTGDHELMVVHENPTTTVVADRAKLRAVLSNLIGNAIKYSPAGTTITVIVRCFGRHLTVSVQDEGPGIAAEHLPYVFDRFFRVRSGAAAPSGYGLGLHIAQRLVELHGGRIWADSTPGQGSRFTFCLLMTASTATGDQPAAG